MYNTTKLSFLAANRKKLAQTEPKLVQSLVALMESRSLKVQCQAALALRNLASDGEYLSRNNGHLTLTLRANRKISARNRQSRRSDAAASSPSLILPSAHSFCRRMCPQRLHSSCQRIAHHRFWVPATIDRITIFRRERRGAMSRYQHITKPRSQQRTEQDSNRGGRSSRANQATGTHCAFGGTE